MSRLAALLALGLVLVAAPSTGGERDGAAVLAVSQGAATLSALDAAGHLVGSLPLDRAPAAIAVAEDGRTAYVSHPELGLVSVVDLDRLAVTGTLAVGGQPFGVAVVADTLYVTDWSGDALVAIAAAGGASRRLAVGRAPSAVVPSHDRRLAYTIDRESDRVSVVDLATLSVTATIPVGRAPFAAALSPDGGRLYVANVQSADLSVVDLAAGRETDRIAVGGMPYGVAVTADGAVLVTDQEGGRLVRLDPDTGEHRRVRVGDYAEGVVVLPGGLTAVVANWFDDSLSFVDLATLTATAVAVPAGPRMLAVRPGSHQE